MTAATESQSAYCGAGPAGPMVRYSAAVAMVDQLAAGQE